MIKYLSKNKNNIDKDYDLEIQNHLKKAKKEILAALIIIDKRKRANLLFRVASRTTEVRLRGILSLIENVPLIKPFAIEEEVSIKKDKKAVKEKRRLRNVRR